MGYVLDTTAFSEAMRNEHEIVQFMKARKPGEILTVPPVIAEIEYGIRRIDRQSNRLF